MTPEKHNKYLALSHLAYAVLYCLMVVIMMIIFGLLMLSAPGEVPDKFFILVAAIILLINLLFVLPSFLAAYALWKRKQWAKTMNIVAAVFAGMFFPFGTAVCVYSFWFLFSEPGRQLYERSSLSAPYVSPAQLNIQSGPLANSTPPDWR